MTDAQVSAILNGYTPVPESEQPHDWSQRKIAPFPGEYNAADQPFGGYGYDPILRGYTKRSTRCPFRAAFRGGGE